MQVSPGPALLIAILTLGYLSAATSDATPSDPALFDRICLDLMGRVLQRGKVRFAQSSDQLSTNSLGLLDEIVEIATDCPALSIAVTGHTDDTGDELINRRLSKARAEAVVAYLTEHGIEPGRLSAFGAGSETPIASNDDVAGRQLNRRIEFAVEQVSNR